MNEILEINMNPREAQCSLCGEWTDYRWGVPTFNGDLVSNDFPNEIWLAEGGNMPVCESCYGKHERGELPTFDQFYLHLQKGFVDGAGI